MLVAIAVMISVAANAHNVMSEVEDSITVSTEKLADILVEEGMKMIGTPYRYGGSGPRASIVLDAQSICTRSSAMTWSVLP